MDNDIEGSLKSMWDNCRQVIVNRDHGIVIPRACSPGPWLGAGSAWLAPLYRKRRLFIERAKWIHAWTLYNDKVSATDWLTPRDTNPALHFPIEIKSRDPSGWYFTIPSELRAKDWLPASGGVVVLEYDASEFNVWTVAAYDEESVLEADSL